MTGPVPSIAELRAQAERQGVRPTDDDLVRVQGFLEAILPQLSELERIVPRDVAPASVFRPEAER